MEVTVLAGQRTSFARMKSPRQHMPQKLENAIFASLRGDPDVHDVVFVGSAEDMLQIEHAENVSGHRLAELFEAAGAKAGVEVTVTAV